MCYFFEIIQFISLVPSNSVVKQVCNECVPTLKTFRRVASTLSLHFCGRLFNVTPLVVVLHFIGASCCCVHRTLHYFCRCAPSIVSLLQLFSQRLPGRYSQRSCTVISFTVRTLSVVSALSCYQYQYNGDREPIPPDGPSGSNQSTEYLVQL